MAPYVGLVVAESVGHPDHWSKRLKLNWGIAIASVGSVQQQQLFGVKKFGGIVFKIIRLKLIIYIFTTMLYCGRLSAGWTTDGAYGQYNIEGPIRSVIDKRRRSGVKCNVTKRSRSAIYYSLMAPYVGLVVAESVGHPDHSTT